MVSFILYAFLIWSGHVEFFYWLCLWCEILACFWVGQCRSWTTKNIPWRMEMVQVIKVLKKVSKQGSTWAACTELSLSAERVRAVNVFRKLTWKDRHSIWIPRDRQIEVMVQLGLVLCRLTRWIWCSWGWWWEIGGNI